MPKMDLTANRFYGGKLYRAGKGVDVPAEAATAWAGGKGQASAPASTAPSAGDSGGLPADYLFRDILHPKYKSHEAVQAASDDELLALDGIGPARLKELRAFEP